MRAHVTKAVVVEGVTALPEGTSVNGVVTDAKRAGKVKGTSRSPCGSTRYSRRANRRALRNPNLDRRAQRTARRKRTPSKIAAPAAGGAIIGGIVGGKKGAVIGGAAGGGAGTAVVYVSARQGSCGSAGERQSRSN